MATDTTGRTVFSGQEEALFNGYREQAKAALLAAVRVAEAAGFSPSDALGLVATCCLPHNVRVAAVTDPQARAGLALVASACLASPAPAVAVPDLPRLLAAHAELSGHLSVFLLSIYAGGRGLSPVPLREAHREAAKLERLSGEAMADSLATWQMHLPVRLWPRGLEAVTADPDSYLCLACPAATRDAVRAQAHHEATGHRLESPSHRQGA